jgi:hypothetical protein
VHYVNYIFDTPAGIWTISFYIFFAYALTWFYGFWCEILVARRFIRLLSPRDEPVTTIPYRFEGEEAVSRVSKRRRTIALHGAGRIKVEGYYDRAYRIAERIGNRKALTFLTPAELLATVRTQLEDHEWTGARDPLPRVRDLQRALQAFPGITGLLALAFIGVPIAAGYTRTAQPPELDIIHSGHVNRDLTELLFEDGGAATAGSACPALGADTPRIAVAASGGGTRAAIYTAAVLRGLAKQGRICDVALVSGVSGGSAALAYFALNEKNLRTPKYDDAAWDRFDEAMAKPFIQTVLNAASDSAVVFGTWRPRRQVCGEPVEKRDGRDSGWWPMRVHFGNLLAESFVCTMGEPARARNAAAATAPWGRMVDVPFGVIFNTGLAGRCKPTKHDPAQGIPEQARESAGDPVRRADVAGGRLVLTNLPEPRRARELSDKGPRDLRFFTLNDPEISVARAAALSANFPPVFADAAIDERHPRRDKRFWVTDGGTIENRGTVTLYLSVGDALAPMAPAAGDTWPELHVVIADVSAEGGAYREGAGIATLQAAGGQMGLALEAELLRDLKAAYRYRGRGSRICVYELPMPGLLRDAIGTHWMMPNGITLRGWDSEEVSLDRDQAERLVSGLFMGEDADPDPSLDTVRAWTSLLPPDARDGATTGLPHAEAWTRLLAELAAPASGPCREDQVIRAN